MEETQQLDIEGTTVENTTEVTVEKKERKKKDVRGGFMLYAVSNPYNGEVFQKRFRESEVPVGVLFCKLIVAKAPPAALKRVCADGSILCTWSISMERLKEVAKGVTAGTRAFFEKDCTLQENVLCLGPCAEKEVKARAPKVPKAVKERVQRKNVEMAGVDVPASLGLKGLLPEEEDDTQLTFESYEEDGSTAIEVRAFSSKKAALVHARELGMNAEESEKAVEKVDGEWVVTQS